MAGARIEIEVKVPPLDKAAQELTAGQRTTLLDDIGEYLVRSTRDRAAREIDPDGTPWAALSPRYKRWKDKKKPGLPMLKLRNHMLGSRLTHQVDGDTLRVGTSAKYGAIHQFGGDVKQPARQSEVFFKRDRRTGEVGNRFATKRGGHFAQSVLRPAYRVKMPARPWLGLSTDDDAEILAIVEQHLEELLSPRAE